MDNKKLKTHVRSLVRVEVRIKVQSTAGPISDAADFELSLWAMARIDGAIFAGTQIHQQICQEVDHAES